MGTLSLIPKELIGMFLDDEFLTIAILIIVAVAAALAGGAEVSSTVAGATLFLGCLFVLLESGWRTRRK